MSDTAREAHEIISKQIF